MGPRGKMVIGALLVVAGVWWYLPGGPFNSAAVSFSTLTNLQSLAVAVQGGLGVLAVIVGLFVVWIERDEMRIRREMEAREFGGQVQQSVKAVAEGGEEEHECPECGETFDTQQGLYGHKGQAHS